MPWKRKHLQHCDALPMQEGRGLGIESAKHHHMQYLPHLYTALSSENSDGPPQSLTWSKVLHVRVHLRSLYSQIHLSSPLPKLTGTHSACIICKRHCGIVLQYKCTHWLTCPQVLTCETLSWRRMSVYCWKQAMRDCRKFSWRLRDPSVTTVQDTCCSKCQCEIGREKPPEKTYRRD